MAKVTAGGIRKCIPLCDIPDGMIAVEPGGDRVFLGTRYRNYVATGLTCCCLYEADDDITVELLQPGESVTLTQE